MSNPPDPAAVARFRADVTAVSGRAPTPADVLALAVSGGADSMAMLALSHAAFPGQIVAATVDHRLRASAADEAAMVARHCAALGVRHETLIPETPIAGASIQARAREARYGLLVDWACEQGAAALLTAHHLDDQAETFLMRAVRGSGVTGLAAIRARRPLAEEGPFLLRPLLGWRRTELRALAQATDTPFADDPSNDDAVYDRTRARTLLARTPALDAAGLAASATYLAEAEAALAAWADLLWAERVQRDGDAVLLDPANLPREVQRRLVRRAIDAVRGAAGITAPAWSHAINIEPLLDALNAGSGATQAGVMAAARKRGWRFVPAPPRSQLATGRGIG